VYWVGEAISNNIKHEITIQSFNTYQLELSGR